jgi:amino-acid N-acetyltransferase
MNAPSGGAVPPVVVREAAPADLPAARRLVERAGLPVDGLDDATLLLAEADGRLVGTAALERHGHGAGTAFLLRSVAAERRDRGVGTALTAAALRRVDAARAPVGLLTETAAAYFTRFGFEPVARDDLPPALAASAELRGACPSTAQAMLRPAAG